MAERSVDPDGATGWLALDPVARQSAVRPGALAVQDLSSGRSVTYAELEAEVRRCEGLLRKTLPERGARVALLARNSMHHVVLSYGCPRAGVVFQPLNWRLAGAELAFLLQDAAPDILIYETEFEGAARSALAAVPVRQVYRIADSHEDEFSDAVAAAEPLSPGLIDPTAPALLLYTSGTTGRPKGVVVTAKSAFFSALNFTFVGELSAQHAQLCDVPLFHVVGLQAILHATLLAGGTVYLSDRFTPAVTLARLADPKLRISHYFCVPQMAQALVDDPAFPATDLTGLRLFTGGAPMPGNLTLKLVDAGLRPSNGYGMSENGTILGVPLDPTIARAKAGSAGVAAPVVEVRLVGPDGGDVANGDVGEIWLRGPSVSQGYWQNAEATAAAFVDGWFRTGDAARRDDDGYYFIVDRWKDMYITGGENVYPAEVEAVLLAMDSVAEAAVLGVPDARWGEAGCAFIVLRSGAQCDPAGVAAWCGERLARYKLPGHVRFVDALPRTASGKVQKDNLRRAFAAQTETQS